MSADESAYEDVASTRSESAAGEGSERSTPEPGLREEDRNSKPTSDIGTRKRRKNDDLRPANVKKTRGLYRDEYRQLYNSTISETNEITRYLPNGNPGRLKPSQIGVSSWTVSEKQLLFSAIETHGRDNVPRIAAIIKTKSEPEVRDLLLLLQEGYTKLQDSAEYPGQPLLHEFSAAYEISEDCCKSLETAADALAKYQNSWDAKQERKKHGDYWLLTSDMAAAFDKALEAEENAIGTENNVKNASEDDNESATGGHAQDEEPSQQAEEDELQRAKEAIAAVPSARLLWLSNWFELSYSVFANAGAPREDENWHSVAEHDEELGIFHTAFSDFHRLVVSVTQRLVAASLNQAASRLRAKDMQRGKKGIEPLVRRQDVLTALEILNMPQSSKSFWVKAPRRCGVIVQQNGETIDYNEAERVLQGEPSPANTASTGHRDTTISGTTTPNVNSPDSSESEDMSDDDVDDDDAPDPQETYAERLDMHQSNLEEEKLWRLLGQSPPPTCATGTVELPEKPTRYREVGNELGDWRDELVDFEAEWERYGKPINHTKHTNTYSSNTARPEETLEPAQRPTLVDRATSGAMNRNRNLFSSDSKARRQLPKDTARQTKKNVEEDDGSDSEDDSTDGASNDGAEPIRRVLAPRQARDAATTSMGELPPYPDDDDDSGSGDIFDQLWLYDRI